MLVPFPGAVIVAGENPAVTPEGSPDTVSAIAPLNPFSAAVVTVIELDPPAANVSVDGAETVNVGETTLSVNVSDAFSTPLVPVIVIG